MRTGGCRETLRRARARQGRHGRVGLALVLEVAVGPDLDERRDAVQGRREEVRRDLERVELVVRRGRAQAAADDIVDAVVADEVKALERDRLLDEAVRAEPVARREAADEGALASAVERRAGEVAHRRPSPRRRAAGPRARARRNGLCAGGVLLVDRVGLAREAAHEPAPDAPAAAAAAARRCCSSRSTTAAAALAVVVLGGRRRSCACWRRLRLLVELAVDEEVGERARRAPRQAVGPPLDARLLLVKDEDGARDDVLALLELLEAAGDLGEEAALAALEDEEGVEGRLDEPAEGWIGHGACR